MQLTDMNSSRSISTSQGNAFNHNHDARKGDDEDTSPVTPRVQLCNCLIGFHYNRKRAEQEFRFIT